MLELPSNEVKGFEIEDAIELLEGALHSFAEAVHAEERYIS